MLSVYRGISKEVLQQIPLTEIKPGDWINLVNPQSEEMVFIAKHTGLDVGIIKSSLDPEERSRIDIRSDYIYLVINAPISVGENQYDALPVGIIVTEDYIITVSIKDKESLTYFLTEKADFSTYNKEDFLLKIIYSISRNFVKHIREVIKKFEVIEVELFKANRNEDIIKIMSLQKGLIFFTTALYSNDLVIARIQKLRDNCHECKQFNFTGIDEELMDDVYTENKQAMEMVTTYSNILTSMMDTFASLIANNQNTFLKLLAIITIILTIPTILAGFWGMNVNIPFEGTRFGFWFVTALSITIISGIIFFLSRKKLLH